MHCLNYPLSGHRYPSPTCSDVGEPRSISIGAKHLCTGVVVEPAHATPSDVVSVHILDSPTQQFNSDRLIAQQSSLFKLHEYSTVPTRPAYRQFGGKWQLAEWIISHFPKHTTYVEPYGGAYSVGLQKASSEFEVYNDIHFEAWNFFNQLQTNTETLITAIVRSPRTKEEFENCKQFTDDPLEKARRYYLHCQLSWSGGGGRWSSGTSEKRLSLPSIQNDSHLWEVAKRIESVEILNQDAIAVIQQFDSSKTLFYVDPPYPHQSRGSKDSRHSNPVKSTPRRQYCHEMTDDQHCALAEALRSVQGMVILSGYHCPLYAELFGDWHHVENQILTCERKSVTEVLWISPNAVQQLASISGVNAIDNTAPAPSSYYRKKPRTVNKNLRDVVSVRVPNVPTQQDEDLRAVVQDVFQDLKSSVAELPSAIATALEANNVVIYPEQATDTPSRQEVLIQQRRKLIEQGVLLGQWVDSNKRRGKMYYRLRIWDNGKSRVLRSLKPEEVLRVRAMCSRGKQVQKIDQQLEKIRSDRA